ncbi:unnamed protein product [Alopecurus aequalis]
MQEEEVNSKQQLPLSAQAKVGAEREMEPHRASMSASDQMSDAERERRYKRFYGEEESPMQAILESPWVEKVWGPRLEGYGLGMLHQARENIRRKKKEEASRRKEKELPEPEKEKIHRDEEQGNSPLPETIRGEEWPLPETIGGEQGPLPETIGGEEEQEQGPHLETIREEEWPLPEQDRSELTDERERRHKSRRLRLDPSKKEASHVEPVKDKDSTSTAWPEPELKRKKIQVDEKGNSQPPSPQPSEQAKVRVNPSSWVPAIPNLDSPSTWITDEYGEWRPRAACLLAPYYRDPDPEAPQYFDDMAKFYLEAARRLPVAQMPKLAGFLSLGGLTLGFNDPVTNIIVNAIYLMGNFRYSDVLPDGADPVRHVTDKASYVGIARKSRAALVVFMVFYFRHLTEAQAKRYLHQAGHDLALAIGLVDFHRKGNRFTAGLFEEGFPDCSRTKIALRYAAQAAKLPQDPNDLVRLLVSRFPRHLLGPVLDDLRRGEQLSVGCVNDILNLLRHPWSPPPPLPAPTPGTFRDADGNFTIIANIGQGLFSTTTIAVDLATTTTFSRHPSDHADDYLVGTAYLSPEFDMRNRFISFMGTGVVQTLVPDLISPRMFLLDTIHGFYIQALAMLPSDHHPRLLHAVLEAGHCYGVMDSPVHNIIINSMWYNLCYPSPNDKTVQIHPRSMTRAASCSLKALMFLKSKDKDCVGLTELYILFHLLMSLDCHVHEVWNVRFAAEVAEHPQPLRFEEIIKGLLPYKYRLQEVMNLKPALSDSDLHVISDIIAGVTEILPRNHDLCQPALMDPGCRVQAFVRTKLEELLINYCRKDHRGPEYKLGIIFGVASQICSSYIKGTTCYHANFLASTGNVPASSSGCRLFFAEFWNQEDDDIEESKMPPVCWPVPHQDIGYHCRCFICESAAIRVVHPFDVNYFMGDMFSTDSLCAIAEHEAATGGKEVKFENRL